MFADVREAADFNKNIQKRIQKIGRDTTATDSDATSVAPSVASAGSARSGGFLKSLFSSKEGGSQAHAGHLKKEVCLADITEDDIGDPTAFRHMSHIGFNPETGAFDVQNIPQQWKQYFSQEGVSEAQLQNKDTAKYIVEFVQKQKGAPPPPPPKTKGAPPPPPPKKKPAPTAKRAPSPPPVPHSAPPPAPRPTQKPALASGKASSIPPPPPFQDYLAFAAQQCARTGAREQEERAPPKPAARPPAPGMSMNDMLMDSIRTSGTSQLKHVDPATMPQAPPELSDPTDAMQGLLAKALEKRKKVMAPSDSDDDEW